MTQSNISGMILDLESRLGVTLCERGRSGFRLTSEGQQVYHTTLELLAELDTYQDRLQSIGAGLRGKLALGHMENYLGHPQNPIVQALATLTSEAPDIELDLRTAPLEALEHGLSSGNLQVIIGTFTREIDGLNYWDLHSEKQGLYCASHHRLALAGQDLKRDQVVNAGYAAGLFGYGEEAGLLKNRVADVHQLESMLVFLLSGRGIGFLPEHVAAPHVTAGQLQQLLPEVFTQELVVRLAVREKSLASPLVRRCMELLGIPQGL